MSTMVMVSVLSVLLGALMSAGPSLSTYAAPKVQIYSRTPGDYGKANRLICHVSGFHPPELELELLQDGLEIPGAQQTDLAFEEDWHYHLTRHVEFIPEKDHLYSCRVTHLDQSKTYTWDADD